MKISFFSRYDKKEKELKLKIFHGKNCSYNTFGHWKWKLMFEIQIFEEYFKIEFQICELWVRKFWIESYFLQISSK